MPIDLLVYGLGSLSFAMIIAVGEVASIAGDIEDWAKLGALSVVVGVLVWLVRYFMARDREHFAQTFQLQKDTLDKLAEEYQHLLASLEADRDYHYKLREQVLAHLREQTNALEKLTDRVRSLEEAIR